MTPFSGISLLLHLAIIGMAKMYYFVSGQPESKPNLPNLSQAAEASPLKRLVSCTIVLAILILMVTSFSRAVATSVREGSKEPQVQFVKHQVSQLIHSDWDRFFGSAKAGSTPEQAPTTPVPPSDTSIYTFSK